jgi:hypothetical protein
MKATYIFMQEKFSGVILEIDDADTVSIHKALVKRFGPSNRAEGMSKGWSDGGTTVIYEAYGSKVLISIIHSVSGG